MLAPLVLLAAGAIGLGYTHLHLDLLVVATTTMLAVLGALPAYALWRRGADPRPVALVRELWVDVAYQRLVVTPVRAAARLMVAHDHDVIGAYVRGTGRAGNLAGQGLRRLQSGNVQTYLTGAVIGVVALAVLAGVLAS